MKFDQALYLKERNQHFIGKKVKEVTIEELILVPNGEDQKKEFFRSYYQTLNGDKAIIPFDVEVFAVFEKKLILAGVYTHENILQLPTEMGVITE